MTRKSEVSVKLDVSVYRLVKAVAGYKGMHVSDYLAQIVRPVVERDFDRINRERAKESGKEADE
jgi:hypothetical protein